MDRREKLEAAEREKRQKKIDERDYGRERSEVFLIDAINVSMQFAQAKALQHISDAHCYGDMDEGLC